MNTCTMLAFVLDKLDKFGLGGALREILGFCLRINWTEENMTRR